LVRNTPVEIRFGRDPVAVNLGFTNEVSPNPVCGITPNYIQAYTDTRYPFANTGRHVFRQWDFGFDPRRGRVGFAENDHDPCAP
jgi:hypothetical protein